MGKTRKPGPSHRHSQNGSRKTARLWAAALASAFVIGFFLYSPAMNGPFLFDDAGLPFAQSTLQDRPLSDWVSGVRPVLMFSYWVNRTLWGDSPVSYHAINVVIHVLNAALVFLALRRLLALSGWTERIAQTAAAGALVFLIHPLQTESVSYIAGRSESLAAFFMLLAYVVFLYRRKEAISWMECILVLALFALAVKTKENAVSLAGILFLTDVFWPAPFSTRGLRRNWRLYALMVPGGMLAAASVFRVLLTSRSAGFSLPGVTWYQYGFTQARAIFVYIRLALFPVGLSIDRDYAVSHTIFEHGAVFWLILLAGFLAACFRLRRKYPLACFGFLFFLAALAPTSSIVPIADPLVERRMYLPLLGLILVGCELSRRVRLTAPVGWSAAALAVTALSGWCYTRNQQFGHPETLFAEAASQSTHNARPYVHLAHTLYEENRCAEEIPYLERADGLFPRSDEIQMEWAGAMECLGNMEEAARRLRLAAQMNPRSDAWEMLGLVYGEMNKPDESGAALRMAVQVKPDSPSAHRSLAIWYEAMADYDAAEREYSRSLALDGRDRAASLGLLRVRQLRARKRQ
jgi:tetratricopeptide (TPR) repeat protein